MNKIIFLTDLRKLLTFMTEEERENTIRYYEGLFEEAGPEKEEELLREFGSPTKAAVTIFREYGKDHTTLDPLAPDEKAALPEVPESFVPENLGLTVPDTIENEEETSEETELTEETSPETEEAEEPEAEPAETEEAEEPEAEPAETEEAEEPEAEPAETEEAEEPEAELAETEEAEEPEAEPAETEEAEEPGAEPAEAEEAAETDTSSSEIEEPEKKETAQTEPEVPTDKSETPVKTIADMAAHIAEGIETGTAAVSENAPEQPEEKKDPVFVEVPVPPRQQPPMESPYVETELREYRLPGWAVALIMVLTCWLWIPVIAALCVVVLALFALLFAVGTALTAGAAYLVICGIWALGVVTDALLMFGAAAILLAFGIVFLWLAIWALIRLFGLLFKGIGGTYRGIFCRKSGKERRK